MHGIHRNKPVRTLYVYDKGSNYLITDTDDTTPLYHIHWNTVTLPYMTVTHAGSGSNLLIGSASFIPMQLGGFFSSADDIRLDLYGRMTLMKKVGGVFSTNKRFFETSNGTMCWKGGVAISGFLRCEDSHKNMLATFKNTAYSGRAMGTFEIYSDPMEPQLLDEIVISGLAMISEDKTSMTGTAASLSSAGAMG